MVSPTLAPMSPRPRAEKRDEGTWCDFIKTLYGPSTPPVPVFGPREAIRELILAVDRDGLFIQQQATPEPADSIKIAYQHLQRKGDFPEEEQLQSLLNLTPQDGLALGIVPEDYHINASAKASPPFKSLNVGQALGALRLTAKYFDEYTTHVLGAPQKHSYQLGVITMTRRADGGPRFWVQLLQSREDVEATGTLWLYRWCVGDGYGGYIEQWRALGDGTFNMAELGQAASMMFPQPVMLTNNKRMRSEMEADEQDVDDDEPLNLESNGQQQRPTKKIRCTTDSASDEGLFDEEPHSIKGSVILALAQRYSNTELFERINAGLSKKNFPLVTSPNVITRRITLAIQSKAANNRGLTVKKVRAELNDARKANGVRERMNIRTQETKIENSKGRKGGVSM